MISTLVTLLIIVLVLGLIFWILQMLPVAQPFKGIVLAIAGIIAIIYLFQRFL